MSCDKICICLYIQNIQYLGQHMGMEQMNALSSKERMTLLYIMARSS